MYPAGQLFVHGFHDEEVELEELELLVEELVDEVLLLDVDELLGGGGGT